MFSPDPNAGPRLVTETNPRVLAAFARIDAMTDDEIRQLVRDEDPTFVEAGEALIADRYEERRGENPNPN